MVRSGDNRTGTTDIICVASVSHTVPRTPIHSPSAPPVSPPIGPMPHTTNRMLAFIRPRRWSGQMACR